MVSPFARTALQLGPLCLGVGLTIRAVLGRLLGAKLALADDTILQGIATLRNPFLDSCTIDLTSLGSGTVVGLATLLIAAMLLASRDLLGALQLTLAAGGALALTDVFKNVFASARPTVVPRLVQVSSYSHPSGHALGCAAVYLSLALIARRHLPRHLAREILIGCTLGMVFVIGFSRLYLGVHFPSDVLAGTLIGLGYALTLAGVFALFARAPVDEANEPPVVSPTDQDLHETNGRTP